MDLQDGWKAISWKRPTADYWNILGFNAWPLVDKAAVVEVGLEEGGRCSFDPATGFIDLPGGMSKFTIRRDPVTGAYLTLSNNNTDTTPIPSPHATSCRCTPLRTCGIGVT